MKILMIFFFYRNKISQSLSSPSSAMSIAIQDYVVKRCDDIIKSENDDRLYRGLVLANEMKVLLISDPGTDKSAAALDVNIGNFIYFTLCFICINTYIHAA